MESVTLTLLEELTILSYDERGKNEIIVGNLFNSCLAGAALIELVWGRSLRVESGAVLIRDPAVTGDPVLERVLDTVRTQPTTYPCGVRTRLSRSLLPNLGGQTRSALLDRGVLHEERGRRLLIFPVRRCLTTDPALEAALVARVRQAALGKPRPDLRTQVLVTLSNMAYLSPRLFSKDEIPQAKRRLSSFFQDLCAEVDKASASEESAAVGIVLQGVEAAKSSWESEGP